MQKIIYIIFLLYFGFGIAQIDDSKGRNNKIGRHIGIINAPTTKVEKPISLEFNESYNGFKTAKKKLDRERQKEKQKQQEESKGILTREVVAKQNFKKNIEGNFMNFPQIDMDLGSFHTKSRNIHISSYDFGRFDGDKVQITINGKRVHNNYLLTPRIKVISIPLAIGINKIEVTALNEGELIPNTGYFAFFDDNKYIIKEGEWMLATGAKVVAIVVREEEE